MKVIPLILAGGFGTRLWPVSRKAYPKQFHKFGSNNSLLQETLLRLDYIQVSDKYEIIRPVVLCNQEHRFIAKKQIDEIGLDAEIIIEPASLNTAPSVVAASHWVKSKYPQSIVLILSSDHYFSKPQEFGALITSTLRNLDTNKITLVGARPFEPNTEYGYIKYIEKSDNSIFDVEKFIEKPSLNSANKLIKNKNVLWNTGTFIFNTDFFLDLISNLDINLYNFSKESSDSSSLDLGFVRLDQTSYLKNEKKSIDYAVIEKIKNLNVVILESSWSDLGTWKNIFNVYSQQNKSSNVTFGSVNCYDSSNNIFYSNNKPIVSIGVDNLALIESSNALLVKKINSDERIEDVFNSFGKDILNETENEEHRPWGRFENILEGSSFKVKRLYIQSNCKLSLQSHKFRSEHWVVIRGIVKVTIGNKKTELTTGQSIYIPEDEIHSIENKGEVTAEIIEVQIGTYLGEDDIIRYEDLYGRT